MQLVPYMLHDRIHGTNFCVAVCDVFLVTSTIIVDCEGVLVVLALQLVDDARESVTYMLLR